MLWGLGLDTWNNLIVIFGIASGGFALLTGGATYIAFQLQKAESAAQNVQIVSLENGTANANARAAAANEAASKANEAAGKANERAEVLEKEAADANVEVQRLTADNLTLQAVLADRHVGIIGIDGPAPADKFFAGLENFGGTTALVQPISGDREAANLANEIIIALRARGWNARPVATIDTNVHDFTIGEGVRVLYPVGKPYKKGEPPQPWFAWEKAAEALGKALTIANLGCCEQPVSVAGFDPANPVTPDEFKHFTTPLAGVYVQVGLRPISLTLRWMAQRRAQAGH